MSRSRRTTTVLCVAEVLSMTGFATYAAVLTTLRAAWGLSNAEAGLISAAFFAGYVAAVPLLTGVTDRVDARRVYVVGTGLSALGPLGFGLGADRLEHALGLQLLAGAGLAGTYMPGLKALTDDVEGPERGRSVALYTSSFGIGASLSLVLAAMTLGAGGWRRAFVVAGLGPVLAGLLVAVGVPPARQRSATPDGRGLGFRAVLRSRALGYILGYAAHCWELFGFRSWMVAFLAFSQSAQPPGRELPGGPPLLAALVNLLGPPASILGNETSGRLGVRRFVRATMVLSAALGCGVALAARGAWYVVAIMVCLYFVAIMADSAALTAAMVAAADPAHRGATMAVHSFLGFGGALLAPFVFGVVLDAAGGEASARAWLMAFASLGAIGASGVFALSGERRVAAA
jgi:MFS family permease